MLSHCAYLLAHCAYFAPQVDDPYTLPPIPALTAAPNWIWNLILRIPTMITPGELAGKTVWLAEILHLSDDGQYTVLDLLETTDDDE